MNPMPSRNWATVSLNARCVSPTGEAPAEVSSARAGGGDAGRVKQKTAARKYRAATMRMIASGPEMLMTSGPSRAKPIAKAALRVRVNTPFAARSWWRGTTSGIIAASAGAKNTVTVDTKMLSRMMSTKLSPTKNRPTTANPRNTLVRIEHDPSVDAVDVDACHGAEQDGRHEERQDEQADRGVRAGLGHDDGQPEQDHVAADLRRGLGQPQTKERPVAEDGQAAVLRVGLQAVAGREGRVEGFAADAHHAGGSPWTAAVMAASPRVTKSLRRRSRVGRSRRT